jgi:hypothetical protein
MPDGQTAGPTVASAQTAASSFFAQPAAETTGPEKGQPGVDEDPAPERGDTYTYDTEVSRPMQELMNPNGKAIQVVRGIPSQPQPNIQNVQAQ